MNWGNFWDGTKSNLESTAVDLYRENKNVRLVPVDLPAPGDQFFIDYEYLQTRIDNTSVDSRRLAHAKGELEITALWTPATRSFRKCLQDTGTG